MINTSKLKLCDCGLEKFTVWHYYTIFFPKAEPLQGVVLVTWLRLPAIGRLVRKNIYINP